MKYLVLSFLPLLIITSACNTDSQNGKKQIMREIVRHGDYYIVNNTKDILRIQAQDIDNTPGFRLNKSKVMPGKKIHIYTFTEGSGGHVMPSNAFSSFRIYSGTIAPKNLKYSGIKNHDWKNTGFSPEMHHIYILTIK